MDPGVGPHGEPDPAAPPDAAVEDPDPHRVYRIDSPEIQALPVVVASPHSGRDYPSEFLAASRLDARALRKSEDCFVDEIFAGVSGLGAPLLAALFPRAYVDANREPFELDPDMFEGPVPPFVNRRSPRVAAGLGTIARVVASGEEIYDGKLNFDDAVERVRRCYHPYHAALKSLVQATVDRFGYCILLDCHSMPSIGVPPEMLEGTRMDMILGDCYGSACAPLLTERAETLLRSLGYAVGRNTPYAGGYTTRHYGRPSEGVHALQIEINRALYMDERTLTRRSFLTTLASHMQGLVADLACLPATALRPKRR